MIYLIVDNTDSRCKIGFSKNPYKRIKQLQTGNPHQLELLFTIPGDKKLEKAIQLKFKAYKLFGEWFLLTEPIKAYFNEFCDMDFRMLIENTI